MIGRLLNTIVNILFMIYMVLLISFFFLHESLKNNINEINYSILDGIATTGVFSEDTYNYLKQQAFKYSGGSSYQLVVKYEKKVKPGVYDTHWKKDWILPTDLSNIDASGDTKSDEILTRLGRPIPMHIGDKVSIYLEDQNQTLFVKLLNAPFLGMLNEYMDMRIKSLKTVIVGRNAKSIVKGYELKTELQQKATSPTPWTNGMVPARPIAVKVLTEANVAGTPSTPGQIYTRAGIMVINLNNISFIVGNTVTIDSITYPWRTSYDEIEDNMKYNASTKQLGENHIFNTAEFYRQVTEYYDMSGMLDTEEVSDYEKVIEFTQK
ncbi:MAG TPA: hypothetical protein DEP72_05425 [Clostridiales bacterium]|nr:MAG: hypothetical protein A2Y18_01885 [Clostridiales bacterium GWD2_32_19]HCC07582.1 hypothetical protein [Clostridiales bacterium]